MPEEEKPKNFVARLKETVENANKLAGLVAAVIAAVTFSLGNHLASYLFIVIAAASLDWLTWTTLTSSPDEQPMLMIASQSHEDVETIGQANTWRRLLAIMAINARARIFAP